MKKLITYLAVALVFVVSSFANHGVSNFFDSGIILNTTKLNSSISFNSIPVIVDYPVRITPISIELYNASYVNGELIVNITSLINWTSENKHIDSSAFPYPIATTSIQKTIANNLTNVLNATVSFAVDNCSISQITYTSDGGNFSRTYASNGYSCNLNRVNLTIIGIEQASSSNILAITYTPSVITVVGGGGAGGGPGGGRFVENPFTVVEDSLKAKLQQGQTTRKSITIINNLDRELKIDISTNLVKFLLILEDSLILKPKETKTIDIDVIAPEITEPDLYVGNIVVKGEGSQRTILSAVEIISKRPLFDVDIDIPAAYRQIYPGEELLATVTLFSIERVGLVDVEIEYIIKDENSKTIYSETESLAVDVQASFIKSLKMPESIEPENYVLYVRATFNGLVGSSSAFFQVVELQVPKKPEIKIPPYVYVIVAVIIVTIFLARLLRNLRRTRIEKKKIIKPHEELHKLRKHIKEKIKENG